MVIGVNINLNGTIIYIFTIMLDGIFCRDVVVSRSDFDISILEILPSLFY